MDLSEKVAYLINIIGLLESAANKLSANIDKPLFIFEEGKYRFKYQTESSNLFQVLKAIRLVSLLNASMHLFKHGHFHEMAILLRAVYESDREIDFVQEAHEKGIQTQDQKRIISLFFERDIKTADEAMATPTKVEKVPKRKIRASVARLSEPFANPERVRRICEVMDDVFSAYVHGELPTIMELYDGQAEHFRLRGMFNTPKKDSYLWQLSSAIMNTMNSFIIVLKNNGLNKLAEEIRDKRKDLEKSEVYQYRKK